VRAVVVVVVACACSRAAPDPVATATPTAICYAGTELWSDARAEPTQMLLRRTLDAAHATFTEEWVPSQVDPSTLVYRVTGARYEVDDQDDVDHVHVGHGELIGWPWAWTSWDTVEGIPNPERDMSVRNVTRWKPDGLAVLVTVETGADNIERSATRELTVIDCKDFETRRARVRASRDARTP